MFIFDDGTSASEMAGGTWGNLPYIGAAQQVLPQREAESDEAKVVVELPGGMPEALEALAATSCSGLPSGRRAEGSARVASSLPSTFTGMEEVGAAARLPAPLGSLVKQRSSVLSNKLERREEMKIKLHLPLSSLPLWLFGILPWDLRMSNGAWWRSRSLWYQRACVAMATAAAVLSVARVCIGWIGDGGWEGLMSSNSASLLADLPLVLCGPLGLLAIHAHTGSTMLCACYGLMMPNVKQTGFFEQWKRQSYFDLCLAYTVCVTAVICRWWTSNAFSGEGEVLHACTFALSSGMLMALCLCMMHVCNSLTALVHAFSANACAEAQNAHEICGSYSSLQSISLVNKWNMIQATIRKSSGALEHLMVCLKAAMLSTILLGAVDGLSTRPSIGDFAPLALLLTLVALAFFRAAAVTDLCNRVPPLINTHVSEEDVDFKCQYVVRYIIDSTAGFYIFDVQVTTAMILKFLYFCGVFVFAVVTKLIA
jgi:hypothetical protein